MKTHFEKNGSYKVKIFLFIESNIFFGNSSKHTNKKKWQKIQERFIIYEDLFVCIPTPPQHILTLGSCSVSGGGEGFTVDFFLLFPCVRTSLSLSLSFLVSPLPRVSCGGWVTPPSSSSLQPLATPGPLFFSLSLSALWLPRCSTKAARSHPSGFIGLGRLTGRMWGWGGGGGNILVEPRRGEPRRSLARE